MSLHSVGPYVHENSSLCKLPAESHYCEWLWPDKVTLGHSLASKQSMTFLPLQLTISQAPAILCTYLCHSPCHPRAAALRPALLVPFHELAAAFYTPTNCVHFVLRARQALPSLHPSHAQSFLLLSLTLTS